MVSNKRQKAACKQPTPAELVMSTVVLRISNRVTPRDQNISHPPILGEAIPFEGTGREIETQRFARGGCKLCREPSRLRRIVRFNGRPTQKVKERTRERKHIAENVRITESNVGRLETAQALTTDDGMVRSGSHVIACPNPRHKLFDDEIGEIRIAGQIRSATDCAMLSIGGNHHRNQRRYPPLRNQVVQNGWGGNQARIVLPIEDHQ